MAQTIFPVPSTGGLPAGAGSLVSRGIAASARATLSSTIPAGTYILQNTLSCKELSVTANNTAYSAIGDTMAFTTNGTSTPSFSAFSEPDFSAMKAISPAGNVHGLTNTIGFGSTGSPLPMSYVDYINGYHYAVFGPSNSQIKLQRSKDLVTWEVVLTGSTNDISAGRGSQQHYKFAQPGAAWYIYSNHNNGNSFQAFVSYDSGASWSHLRSNAIGVGGTIGAVAYGAGIFVTFSTGNNSFYSSTNGFTWTQRTAGLVGDSSNIVYVPDTGVFLATGGGYVYTSTNGTSWTMQVNNLQNTYYAIAYGNNTYMLAAMSGGTARVYTAPSTNLASWTSRNTTQSFSNGSSYAWQNYDSHAGADLEFLNGRFYAAPARHPSGPAGYLWSTDGVTWTAVDTNFKYRTARVNSLGQLVMSSGRDLSVSDNGSYTVYQSKFVSTIDGINFTTSSVSFNPSINQSAYASSGNIDLFVINNTGWPNAANAFHELAIYNTSTDTWSTAACPGGYPLAVTVSPNGTFYLATTTGSYTSNNGSTWSLSSSNAIRTFSSNPGYFTGNIAADRTGFYFVNGNTVRKLDLEGNVMFIAPAAISAQSNSFALAASEGVLLYCAYNNTTAYVTAIDTRNFRNSLVSLAAVVNDDPTAASWSIFNITSIINSAMFGNSWSVSLNGNMFTAMYLGSGSTTGLANGETTYVWNVDSGSGSALSPTARSNNVAMAIANMGIIQGTPTAVVAEMPTANNGNIYPKLTYLQAGFRAANGFGDMASQTNLDTGRMFQWISYGTGYYNDSSTATNKIPMFHTNPKYGNQSVAFPTWAYSSGITTPPLYHRYVIKMPFTPALFSLYSVSAQSYS